MTLPSDLVELRAGPLVRVDALQLAVALEARGHGLTEQDGKLHVTNGAALTAADRAAITGARLHLLAIAAYEAPHE